MYKFFNEKNKKSSKLKLIFITSFLLYFISTTLIYSHSSQKNEDYLIPMGNVIQIEAQLENLVVRSFVEGSPFCVGDSVLEVNNTKVECYKDFSDLVSSLPEETSATVLLKRGRNTFSVETTKFELEKVNCNNFINGFATLTYLNPTTKEFGAIGHPISIGVSKKIPIKNGSIYNTSDLNIDKSSRGHVGYISAMKKDIIGKFNSNTEFGIKGTMASLDTANLKPYKVASLDEVKLGKAQIMLQTSSDKKELFDIQITDIQPQRYPKSKTFKIKVTDKNLLALTGGIVQGMSGTPIIQDDKIIGAISHAVENDPSVGYAVYIRWMSND